MPDLCTLSALDMASLVQQRTPKLVGPAGSEPRLLSLAAQIEELRPWPRLAPDVHAA